MLAWILVLVFLWTTAGFAVLWLITRKKLHKLEVAGGPATVIDSSKTDPAPAAQTADARTAIRASNQASSNHPPQSPGLSVAAFENDAFELLDLNSTIIDEEKYFFGVARKDTEGVTLPSPFLIKDDISHLSAGDSFTSEKGKMVKLGNASAANGNSTAADTNATAPADQGKTVFNQVATEKPVDATDSLTYLEITQGPDAGTRFHLPYAKSMIGRDYDNELTLTDEGLSRKHCFIEWTGNHFRIVDNESTNGTHCNDKPVTMQILEFNDVITISDTRLQYSCKAIEIKDEDPGKAIDLLKACVSLQPDFLTALQHLAFLMERDLRLKKDAAPLWKKISKLEKSLEKQKNKSGNLQASN